MFKGLRETRYSRCSPTKHFQSPSGWTISENSIALSSACFFFDAFLVTRKNLKSEKINLQHNPTVQSSYQELSYDDFHFEVRYPASASALICKQRGYTVELFFLVYTM